MYLGALNRDCDVFCLRKKREVHFVRCDDWNKNHYHRQRNIELELKPAGISAYSSEIWSIAIIVSLILSVLAVKRSVQAKNHSIEENAKDEQTKSCNSWKTIYSIQNRHQDYAVTVAKPEPKSTKIKKSVSFRLYDQDEISELSDLSEIKADISNIGNSKRIQKNSSFAKSDLLKPKNGGKRADKKQGVVAGFFGDGQVGGGTFDFET